MIPTDFQKHINQELKTFFNKKRALVKKQDERLVELVDQIADVTLRGGDRLRPYCAYLGYQISNDCHSDPGVYRERNLPTSSGSRIRERSFANAQDDTVLMPVLLALELTHTFALIHDDIMDQGETRRGGPTIHAYFTKNYRSQEIATSLAILAGDLAYQWGQELFDEVSTRSDLVKGPTFIKLFNTQREEIMLGQTNDVLGMKGEEERSILTMYRAKSGNYSVEKPLMIGAALGGASAELLQALSDYGQAIGLAFQLKDDLLGIFGDEEHLGKSTSSDITEGKWTLLIAYTYKELDKAEQQKLLSIVGNSHATQKEMVWVKTKIVDTGSRRKVEKKMEGLVRQGKKAVETIDSPYTSKLIELADFIIQRNM